MTVTLADVTAEASAIIALAHELPGAAPRDIIDDVNKIAYEHFRHDYAKLNDLSHDADHTHSDALIHLVDEFVHDVSILGITHVTHG